MQPHEPKARQRHPAPTGPFPTDGRGKPNCAALAAARPKVWPRGLSREDSRDPKESRGHAGLAKPGLLVSTSGPGGRCGLDRVCTDARGHPCDQSSLETPNDESNDLVGLTSPSHSPDESKRRAYLRSRRNWVPGKSTADAPIDARLSLLRGSVHAFDGPARGARDTRAHECDRGNRARRGHCARVRCPSGWRRESPRTP